MPVEVKLPEVGENVTSGQVVRLLVAVGDTVEKGQSILELETDKAAIEVPADSAGVVKAIHVRVGDVVQVGQLLLTLDGAATNQTITAGAPAPVTPSTKPVPPAPVAPPTAPASPAPAPALRAEAPPPPAPPTARSLAGSAPIVSPPSAPAGEPTKPAPVAQAARLVPAAPSVRRLARELGIEIDEVAGSGPAGRVSIEDVKAHARRMLSGASRAAGVPPAVAAVGESTSSSGAPPLPDFTEWGEVERRSMSNVRRLTAERMSKAWSVIPQVTQFDHADVTELEALRRRFVETHKPQGVRLTLTPIILKAASVALVEMPQLNASLDVDRQEIVLKKYRHIAVAVDTERGLLAPVVRDVDKKPVFALAHEVEDIARRAREKKIQVSELRGATFTVTNLGGIGGTAFSPIVNHPEVAVLGVARSEWTPRFQSGAFVPRLMLPLALSYDHRLVDGADGARFLRRVAALLEDPLTLLLEPV